MASLTFQLLRIRVRILPGYWLLFAFVSLAVATSGLRSQVPDALVVGVCAGLGVTLCLLVQELAQALTARCLGYRADVVLYVLGSATVGHPEPLPKFGARAALIGLAGPLATLCAGAALLLALWSTSDGISVIEALHTSAVSGSAPAQGAAWLAILNISFGALNLLPILPFGGGRIARAVLGPERVWVTTAISAAVATCICITAMSYGQPFFALLFAFFALRALTTRHPHRASTVPTRPSIPQVSDNTLEQALRRGEYQLKRQEFDKASVIAQTVVGLRSGTRLGARALELSLWARLGAGDVAGVVQALGEFSRKNAHGVDPYVFAAALEATGQVEAALRTCQSAIDKGDERLELLGFTVRLLLANADYANAAKMAQSLTEHVAADELRRVAIEAGRGGAAVESAELSFRLAKSEQGCFSDAVQSTVGFLATRTISRATQAFKLAAKFDARRARQLLSDPRFSEYSEKLAEDDELGA